MESSFLKNSNYNVKNLSLNQARLNGQCVRLGDSELLRCIRRIKKSEYSPEYLSQLLDEKKNILSKKDKKEYRQTLIAIEEKIDNLLFISDIISVKFSDNRHYANIIKKGGILLNGKRYVRLLCSSGNVRQNTVFFANDEIIDELRWFLNCGRNLDYKINKNKFNSYYALANSGSHPVSTPIFVIIPDMTIEQKMVVDKITESPKGKDAVVQEIETTQNKVAFDGMGLISPDFARQWAFDDLELNYLPASFIYRMGFGKGLLTIFDFKELARQNNVKIIKDIYGTEHFVDDIDVCLTESQFKLIGAYDNIEQYREEIKKRNFSFGVSRVSPEFDKDTANLCYQYLQCLDIKTDEDIENICAGSIDWLKSVSFDQKWMLLFLLSGLTKTKLESSWFEKLSDPIIKALLLESSVANDDYIRSYIGRLIRKIEKETFIGSLRVSANYQFVVCDPYGLAQHVLGLSVTGLLKDRESYSQYWNKKEIDEVTAFRSPTTGRSEPTPLHLKKNYDLDFWFQYQTTNIVINLYGDDAQRLSGCDEDGDLLLTTPLLNKYVYGGLIPFYDRKIAEKEVIVEDGLWKGDVRGFKSPVGLLTNLSTSIFSMLPLFEENDQELEILINRLKIATALQNQIIDSQKGIVIMPFPTWWSDKGKEEDIYNLSEEEKELYEKIRITKRPYFFRYLYNKYAKEYKKYLETYENISQVRMGMSFKELRLKNDKTEKEQELIDNFEKYSPLLDSFSTMNRLCHFMEQEVAEIRKTRKNPDFDWHIYLDDSIEIDQNKLSKMRVIYKEFSDDKGGYNKEQKDESIFIFRKKLYEITSNLAELTNMAVVLCYKSFPKRSKNFLWKLLPHGVIANLNRGNIIRTISLPIEDQDGEFKYLNKNYSFYNLEI